MKKFEYEVTKHPAEQFEKVVYFCNTEGECNYEGLPSDQMGTLEKILNERGSQGWELVQIFFGKNGILAFWKRKTKS
jgi:hypothetical protein